MTGKGLRMARRFAVLLVACLIVVDGEAFADPVSVLEPGLLFEQTAHNFGRIQKIDPLEFVFSFKNTSAVPVTIANVVTSCGCTAAIPGKTEYQPGEKGTITATFNPAGHSGLFESTIAVEEKGGARHVLTLAADMETLDSAKLKINLPNPIIAVTPDKVHLGTFKVGATALFKVIVENKGDGDLYLAGDDTPNEAGVRLDEKAIKKGKKIELTLFYKPEKAGKINDFVTIRSNDPKRPEVKIHLTGNALKPPKTKKPPNKNNHE